MKFKAKYEVNGEKVYTAAQFKEILEFEAQCRLELAFEFMKDKSNPASLRLASHNLVFSNVLVSFAKNLYDYLD